jgi:segregation and condensation protein A
LQAEKRAPKRAKPAPVRPESIAEAQSPSVEDQRLNTGGYRVSLPMFEGPLDLLLHLVQKHELDILNIPIAFITERYVEYIQLLDDLNIDLASEYLVMAATLVHIKSRMLLPNAPEDESGDGTEEDELDPRAELVRRLLEYQKYKLAAEQLGERAILGRDVFPRGSSDEMAGGEAPLEAIASFKLLDAFQAVLERTQKTREHQIDFERFSLSDKIGELSELLRRRRRLVFHEIFRERATRAELIITFLALLEMTRLRLTRLRQEGPLEPIYIELTVADDELPPEEELPPDELPPDELPLEAAQTPGEGAAADLDGEVATDAFEEGQPVLNADAVLAAEDVEDEDAAGEIVADEPDPEVTAAEVTAADVTADHSYPDEAVAAEGFASDIAPDEAVAVQTFAEQGDPALAGAAEGFAAELESDDATTVESAPDASIVTVEEIATEMVAEQSAAEEVAAEEVAAEEVAAEEVVAEMVAEQSAAEDMLAEAGLADELLTSPAHLPVSSLARESAEAPPWDAPLGSELASEPTEPEATAEEAAVAPALGLAEAPEEPVHSAAPSEQRAWAGGRPPDVEPPLTAVSVDELPDLAEPQSARTEAAPRDSEPSGAPPDASAVDPAPEELAPAEGETEPRLAADPREYE